MANEPATQERRDVARQDSPPPPANLFARGPDFSNVAQGAVSIEAERAVAEVQAQMIVARRFPRDEMRCRDRFLAACRRPSFAQRAFYSYSRGGSTISGPSIRFAEEAARCYENFQYGMQELSNGEGATEMRAFAIDLELNVRSTQDFTVKHERDTKRGGQALTENRDIYEIGANMGARRMRARILAVLPADYVEEAVETCRKTLERADAEVPLADRIKRMADAYAKKGVTVDMLVKRLGHPLDQSAPHELDTMRGVLQAIIDGITDVATEFTNYQAPDPDAEHAKSQNRTGDAVAGAAQRGEAEKPKTTARKAATPKEEPKTAAKEEPKTQAKPEPETQAESNQAQDDGGQETAQEPAQEAEEPEGATAPAAEAADQAGDAATGAGEGGGTGGDLF